jgi:hypothetical protein
MKNFVSQSVGTKWRGERSENGREKGVTRVNNRVRGIKGNGSQKFVLPVE